MPAFFAPLISDNFDRADANPVGGSWTQTGVNNIKILSNVARNHLDNNDGGMFYSGATWSPSQSSKCKLTATSGYTTGDGGGPSVRMAAGPNGYELICNHAASNNIRLRRQASGTPTTLQTVTQAWTDGDTWELRIQGSLIKAFLNGTLISSLNTTDTTYATGSPGVAYSSEGASEVTTYNDWVGSILVPAPVNINQAVKRAAFF